MTPSTRLFSLVLCLPVRRTQPDANLRYANTNSSAQESDYKKPETLNPKLHLSFQSSCHGLFLVVFVLFIVAASILTAVALACDLPVRLSGAAPVLQLRKFPHA